MASHPADAKNKSVISFYPPEVFWPFNFFTLANAVKYLIQVSMYSGLSNEIRNPISNTILLWSKAVFGIDIALSRIVVTDFTWAGTAFIAVSHLHTILQIH